MATRRDIDKDVSSAISLSPAARTATANGTAVDLSGFGAAVAILAIGTWTDGTHAHKLQESDASGSGFADIAAGDLSGAFTDVTSNAGVATTQEVGYLGSKRYLRAVQTVTAAPATGLVSGVNIIRGDARTKPQ